MLTLTILTHVATDDASRFVAEVSDATGPVLTGWEPRQFQRACLTRDRAAALTRIAVLQWLAMAVHSGAYAFDGVAFVDRECEKC